MADGVLLDTSFLISFADPTRKHHAVAKRYFSHFVDEGLPMYLSTIVASEFQLGQPITDLPLTNFITLPFNLRDAVLSAELDFRLYSGSAGTTRAALKDDFKILGQAKSYQIAYLITEDERTLYRFCEELRKTGIISTRAIKLADGFSRSHFDPQGQTDIDSQLDESSETAQ
jgi:hypothetical protein